MDQQPKEQRVGGNFLVGFSFKDRKSVRDAVDLLVLRRPDLFADRAEFCRKAVHLSLRTLELESQQQTKERSESPDVEDEATPGIDGLSENGNYLGPIRPD